MNLGPSARIRLAYLATHPIQYQAPLLRRIAAEPDIELNVFFESGVSVADFIDPGFNRTIRWDVPLLDAYEYEFLPPLRSKSSPSFWWPMSYGLAARLKAGRFDALWVHGYMRWHHWTAMLAAKRLGIKVLLRDEATAISANRGIFKSAIKKLFFHVMKCVVDRFLAIGTLNRNYYRQYEVPERRIFMMPYAVDNGFFQTRARASLGESKALRRSLELAPNRPVILYAGKMTARKRPDDLFEAYRCMSPDGRSEPGPYLLYVGDGELLPLMEARASLTGWNSVRFLGFKTQTELPAFYGLCDVFVMPSLFEPWGLVVNEAMNAGKPIVASDRVGCVPDLVHNGENGAVFRAGDIADLSRALRGTLANPERCANMGRRSLEIIERWSFEEDVLGLRAALDSTLKEKGERSRLN